MPKGMSNKKFWEELAIYLEMEDNEGISFTIPREMVFFLVRRLQQSQSEVIKSGKAFNAILKQIRLWADNDRNPQDNIDEIMRVSYKRAKGINTLVKETFPRKNFEVDI